MYPGLNIIPSKENQTIEPPIVYIHREATWKYRHISYELQAGSAPQEEALNELGSAGWELAGMFVHEGALHLYFKRPEF